MDRRLAWLAGAIVPLALYAWWDVVVDFRPGGVRLLFDSWDIAYYFQSSGWAVGPARLYVDERAEYPFLANLLFGVVRWAASWLRGFATPEDAFAWLWMSLAWVAYVSALRLVWARLGGTALLMWIAPAMLYFALLRYDVYPALACLLALAALQREQWTRGAVWLGACIALKGYALFLLPALSVFLGERVGWRRTVAFAAVAIGPFALGHLVAYAMAGTAGALHGYRYQLERPVTIESTYGAVAYVAGVLGLWSNAPGAPVPIGSARLAVVLQVASALAAAAFRPRSFDDLVDALLFALLGFVVGAIFWSEQFILWIAAVACFSSRRLVLVPATAMCWLTYVEFPVLHDLVAASRGDPARFAVQRAAWRSALVLTTTARVLMMAATVPWRSARASLLSVREDSERPRRLRRR